MSKITTIVDNIITKVNEHTTDVTSLEIINSSHIPLSGVTAYHLLNGNLSVDNTVSTNGFGLYLYTGNTTTLPTINLGMDITSGDNGYLIKIKSRSAIGDWTWINSVRGITKYISSNTTAAEGTDANMFTLNTVAGVTTLTLGSSTRTNVTGTTYVVEVYQTTHRITGTTNHNKAYTCHYNPTMGFSIDKYEGSGIAGHEIPHSLGRKLGFVTVKNLNVVENWLATFGDFSQSLQLNTTIAQFSTSNYVNNENKLLITSSGVGTNASTNQYIIYGWANSYYDEAGKLIGNYLTNIDSVGVLRLSVHTNVSQSQIMWQMSKTTLTAGDWDIVDFTRGNTKELNANLPAIESTITPNTLVTTASPATYARATDTSNVQVNNAIIPLAHGIDSNGSKNSIVVANETITGLTYTQGKNYLYKTDTGYGVTSISPSYGKTNPLIGDFYNVINNKWYSNTNAEITESRNYLNHVVHADQNGQVIYVEELPKIEYKDIIKANEFRGKNANSLSVAFDLTTTPITIQGELIGCLGIVRTGAGIADIYIDSSIDVTKLKLNGITNGNQIRVVSIASNKITIETSNSAGTATSYTYTSINGVGE